MSLFIVYFNAIVDEVLGPDKTTNNAIMYAKEIGIRAKHAHYTHRHSHTQTHRKAHTWDCYT